MDKEKKNQDKFMFGLGRREDKETEDLDRAEIPPGDPRNPEYCRSLFIRCCDNDYIVEKIRAAQKKQEEKRNPWLLKYFLPKGSYLKHPFPTDEELFTREDTTVGPVYAMACNGAPTVYLKKKDEKKSNGNGTVDGSDPNEPQPGPSSAVTLDEDLRKKVESLSIGERAVLELPEEKTYDDWKDELPIHLKSLKFMIGVLNDRHKRPMDEFPSRPMPPVFGGQFRGMRILSDTWTDCAFGAAGVGTCPDGSNKITLTKRPVISYPPVPSIPGLSGRRPRAEAMRTFPRRRTKSAEPDLSSYRNETPFGSSRSYKHRNSEPGISTPWFRKRRSVEHAGGVYVVEEISEEDEEEDENKRIGSADGSPDSLSLDMELGLNAVNPTESLLNGNPTNPLKPLHRLRRDLWNISPISEDFSESDANEMGVDVEADANSSISSTNATFGDLSMNMSVSSRLNCTSPILSHSPSLLKTPVSMMESTPKDGKIANAENGSGAARKLRDIARALDDMEEDEEPVETGVQDSFDDEEEKTESFEIDLSAGKGDVSMDVLNTSFSKEMKPTDDDGDGEKQKTKEGNKETVWETLSASIEKHIETGNPAGFVEGDGNKHPQQS